jgi:type II secretory pathway component PulK
MTSPARAARARSGFALLAMLWVIVIGGAIASAGVVAASLAVRTAHHRSAVLRSAWVAEGCVEMARFQLVASADGRDDRFQPDVIMSLVAAHATAMECRLTVHPAGLLVEVHPRHDEVVRRLLLGIGIDAARADSLVEALMDWVDDDEERLRSGVEREWYTDRARTPPRNGPLAAIEELRLVRGFERPVGVERFLTAEPGRIAINHAPAPVLRAIPGFTDQLVDAVLIRRRQGVGIRSQRDLVGMVTGASRDTLLYHFSGLAALTTPGADAWIVRAEHRQGPGSPTVTVELRVSISGATPVVVRRRRWTS